MVKRGYKQSEIGIIPEDWQVGFLEQLMKIETGNRNTEHKKDIGKYPFYVRSQTVEKIDTYNYDCEAILTAGDGVGTGKVFHYINGKFDAHQRVYIMSKFIGINAKYFFNYFKENFYYEVSKYTAKSSVDSVRKDMIAKMLIPLPPLLEQEEIAEVLSDTEELTTSLEKLIEKKKAIKQGANEIIVVNMGSNELFPWNNKRMMNLLQAQNDMRVITLSPSSNIGSTLDFKAEITKKGYKAGYEEGNRFFEEYSKKIDFETKVRKL